VRAFYRATARSNGAGDPRDQSRQPAGGQHSFSSAHDSAQRGLRLIQRELRLNGIPETATLITGGTPAQAIHEAARRYKPELLVLGLHGDRAMLARTLGATARMILPRADYPVFTVGAEGLEDLHTACSRVLFVSDAAAESLRAAHRAWPRRDEPGLTSLDVVLPPGAAADSGFHTDPRQYFSPVRLHPSEGAAEAILQQAAVLRAELIVLAVRVDGYLDVLTPGNTAYAIVTGASCPVLTVRA
jgi:nucleotide-binding universal stress UspA family protein